NLMLNGRHDAMFPRSGAQGSGLRTLSGPFTRRAHSPGGQHGGALRAGAAPGAWTAHHHRCRSLESHLSAAGRQGVITFVDALTVPLARSPLTTGQTFSAGRLGHAVVDIAIPVGNSSIDPRGI